jgi:hypothetical protein
VAPRRIGRSDLARELALTLGLVGLIGLLALGVSSLRGGQAHDGHESMTAMGPMGPMARRAHSDGLSEIEWGYRLVPVTVPERIGPARLVEFRIVGPDGRAVTDFEVNATKRLHFFVVRDDMSHFQHVHPADGGGLWRTRVAIPDGGNYRMYAEFVPPGSRSRMHPTVLGSTFIVPGDTTYVPMPEPAASVRVGAYAVTRLEGSGPVERTVPNTLTFAVTDADDDPVTDLEPHLGSYAHISAFNALSLSVTHLHPTQRVDPGAPAPEELSFQARFAERGEHRIFLEFRVDGVVHTAPITLFVD